MNDVYRAERDSAIRTMCAAVDTYQLALAKRMEYPPNEKDAAILTAYIQTETVLLQLLKEQMTDHDEGGGDHRRRATRTVKK